MATTVKYCSKRKSVTYTSREHVDSSYCIEHENACHSLDKV